MDVMEPHSGSPLPGVIAPRYAGSMTLFTRSLWPENTRLPYLQLAAAVVAAPLLLAAVLTLLAFLIAGSSEPDRESTLEVTNYAAAVFFIGLSGFTATFGLAGVAALWALGRRGVLALLAAGALASMAALALQAVVGTDPVSPPQVAVFLGAGAIIFALIRWIAGIRAG